MGTNLPKPHEADPLLDLSAVPASPEPDVNYRVNLNLSQSSPGAWKELVLSQSESIRGGPDDYLSMLMYPFDVEFYGLSSSMQNDERISHSRDEELII